MALFSCPECSKEISDQADFCPHCGFSNKSTTTSSTPIRSAEIVNREVFKAANHSFVLGEITSISRIETRGWIFILSCLPPLAGIIYLWNADAHWMVLLFAAFTSMGFIGFFVKSEGAINSTGTLKELTEDADKIRQEYAEKIGSDALISYKKKTLLYTTEFTINPARVSGFTTFKGDSHMIAYLIGTVAIAAAAYFFNQEIIISAGLSIAAGFFIGLGILLRKGGIEIDAVGGKTVHIYTLMKDIKPIAEELELKISQRADVF